MDIEKNATAGACVAIARADRKKAIKETGMKCLFIIAATLFIIVVATVCIYLFILAVPTIAEIGFVEFLFGTEWIPSSGLYGIGTMIVGTAYATAGALIVGVPIGLLTAVFMAFYCPAWLYRIIKPMTNILAGIPSIVYGYFGLKVIVPFVYSLAGEGTGMCLLTTALILGVMILPTVISITENSLRAVPKSYFEGAVALGATKERAIFRTVFPAAGSGVLTAIILALGRAFGETAAVVIICGNKSQFPTSLFDPFSTLSSLIANQLGYAEDLHREALIACAAVLFVFILIITVIVMFLRKKER